MAFLRQNGGFSDGADGGDSGIELTLGLSLNGRFGVDPTKMPRSSTVPSFPPVGVDGGSSSQFPAPAVAVRAYSMPSEAEVESYRKLKEIRTVAKRRRYDSDDTNSSQEAVVIGDGHGHSHGVNHNDAPPRSVGLQASSSSVIKAADGGNQPSAQAQDPKAPMPVADNVAAATETEEQKSPMVEMPTVSTVGPTGRRVYGILYRYAREEEITIMCVCHGSFMNPAEFVKHAGGEAVNNGRSQITVLNPCGHAVKNLH